MRTSPFRPTRLLLALLPTLLASLTAEAGRLEGTVVGRSGQPKPYVRVEVAGPASQTLFTSEDGSFSTEELPGGSYSVRVTERNRREQFEVKVPDKGQTTRKLQLEW